MATMSRLSIALNLYDSFLQASPFLIEKHVVLVDERYDIREREFLNWT